MPAFSNKEIKTGFHEKKRIDEGSQSDGFEMRAERWTQDDGHEKTAASSELCYK